MKTRIAPLGYQYSITQFLYWVTCCAGAGFVAVYLQHKGLSNATVGVLVSGYGVASLLIQPLNAGLIRKVPFLSVRKMIMVLLVIMWIAFAAITCFPMANTGAILLFLFINALNGSMIPLLSSLGMEYVNQGKPVNFGLARGFGSLGWAVSAVVIGFLLEKYSPDILGYIYMISAGLLVINLCFMEDMGKVENEGKTGEKQTGVVRQCLQDKTFRFVMLGIFFGFISHALCTTYTINIVRSVGGNESAAGWAQFFGAAGEMIGMLVFGHLIHKYSSLKILKISAIFIVVRFLCLFLAGSLPMVILGYALQAPSAGLYIPATVYFVNERMLPQHRTQGQTVFNLLTNSLASFVGNLLGGTMIDNLGLRYTLLACLLFGVIGCGCIVTRREE